MTHHVLRAREVAGHGRAIRVRGVWRNKPRPESLEWSPSFARSAEIAMGDRTYVVLTVPLAHKQEVLQICKNYSSPSEQEEIGTEIVQLHFEEVNYGELPFLEELQHRGIAYDSEWEDGGSYTKGGSYLRFTEQGKAVHKEIYDNCRNPDLNTLLQVVDDPVALRAAVLAHLEFVKVMDWTDQVERGKTYQVMQLLQVGEPCPT